jgi:hypothetical protein
MQLEVAVRAFDHRLPAVLPALAGLRLEAVAAVDRPIAARFEWETRDAAAIRADCFEHWARAALCLFAFSRATAGRAALRFSCESARRMELLLSSSERELRAAFDTDEVLVFVHA